jgi:stalled ribosome rescue protein Dom34
MKQQNKKQHAGVWIDNQKAMIITENDGDFAIKEKLKADENFGGGSEHSINNAKQSGNLKYFKTISSRLLNYDEILIFGPGKSQEQLQNHLEEDAQFNKKKITIDSAEHITEPQMIAMVRDFFK